MPNPSTITWRNHHENIAVPVAKIVTPRNRTLAAGEKPTLADLKDTAANIQKIIKDALRAGARIRAVGSHWSFSNIPVVENGWIVETHKLDHRFDVRPAVVRADSPLNAEELYFVQCGTKISRINEALETPNEVFTTPARRRALRTSGASNGQTIGGALGTGVHGSALEVGGMECQVAGIQLLTAHRNMWIEPESTPAMTDDFIHQLGAEPVRNDLLFSAALVSLGSLGIVHAVMLKTTRRYLLKTSSRQVRYSRIKRALNDLDFRDSGLIETPYPYFFQAIIDPDDLSEKGDRCRVYTLTRYRFDCDLAFKPDYALEKEHTDGTDLPKFIAWIIQLDRPLRDLAVSLLMFWYLREFEEEDSKKWKTPGQVYTFTEARRGVASSGFAVPTRLTTRALEIMSDEFRRASGAAVVLTCRYAQKSPALLGFTRHHPTCVVDIDGIDSDDTKRLIRNVAARFDREGMPYTMHWGKTHHLTKQRVKNAYGGDIARWNQARRELIPDQAERDAFSSDFIDAIGLNG